MRFQSGDAVFKFLLRSVGGALENVKYGFLPHIVSASDIYLFIYLFIYLSTDRSARHVVSSLGVST